MIAVAAGVSAHSTGSDRGGYSPGVMPDRDAPDEARIRTALYDAPRLLQFRRALRDVSDASEPRAAHLAGPTPGAGATVALLPGSFNPPTAAHVALARAGLDHGVDLVLFALAARTVDKEVVTGAALEDRLLLLELIAAGDPRLGVVLVNRGLYVDQAAAVRAAFPRIAEVVFLVGHDKIVQIFDPRYYDDRDAALERLFGLARILVAPRAEDGPDELAALLDEPANRRFAPAVGAIDLPSELRHQSASDVRAGAATADLPLASRVFVEETAAYAAPPATGHYAARLALLDELAAAAEAGASEAELRVRFRVGADRPVT